MKIIVVVYRMKSNNTIIQIGNIREGTPNFQNPQSGRVYAIDGIAPTINTCQGVIYNQKY